MVDLLGFEPYYIVMALCSNDNWSSTNSRKKSRIDEVRQNRTGVVNEIGLCRKLALKQNFYFDLVVGPTTRYKNGDFKKYEFFSLDEEVLFHIDYDTVDSKSIEELNNGKFMFWHLSKYSISGSDSLTDLFIYLPNPPKIKFTYSLCITDEKFTSVQIIKEFNSENVWETVGLNFSQLKENQRFAIRLKTETPFTGDKKNAVMFKKI